MLQPRAAPIQSSAGRETTNIATVCADTQQQRRPCQPSLDDHRIQQPQVMMSNTTVGPHYKKRPSMMSVRARADERSTYKDSLSQGQGIELSARLVTALRINDCIRKLREEEQRPAAKACE